MVRLAAQLHRRALFAHGTDRDLDEVAGCHAGGRQPFIQQIFQAFFLINCTNLSELIRTGKLDFLLLLPVNTRFVVSLRQVDLGGFVNATFALAVMAYAQISCTSSPTWDKF